MRPRISLLNPPPPTSSSGRGKKRKEFHGSSTKVAVGKSYTRNLEPGSAASIRSKPSAGESTKRMRVTQPNQHVINAEEAHAAEEALKDLSAAARNRIAEHAYDYNSGFDNFISVAPEDSNLYDDVIGEAGEVRRGLDITHIDIIEGKKGPEVIRRKYRQRTRRHRLVNRQKAVDEQISELATAYLEYRYRIKTACGPNDPHPDVDSPYPEPTDKTARYFTMTEICGLTWIRNNWAIPWRDAKLFNTALIHRGLLSNAPITPTWAVSLHTLATYRAIRLVKPNTSVQAFVRAMCIIQGRTCSNSLVDKFSDAFDTYLAILREVERRKNEALGRNAPHWRIKHCCPACLHRVEGEPQLEHVLHWSIDGGQSNKRFKEAGHAAAVLATYPTEFILNREEVNKWAHVVKRQKVVPKDPKEAKKQAAAKRRRKQTARRAIAGSDVSSEEDSSDDDQIDVNVETQATTELVEIDGHEYIVKNFQGDPTDGISTDLLKECVSRWKANAADIKKGMFSCFDESGSFIGVCRHGILLIACDMVQSGELAKYPLSVIEHVERHIPGPKMTGFDIWCAFKSTVAKAGFGYTGSGNTCGMHGWAHNRRCQLDNHPLYTKGAGLTDFEMCERFFAACNLVAVLTRHATTFHRHQFLELFFAQQCREKLENLGKYIFYNYRQALGILAKDVPILDDVKRAGKWVAKDYEEWLEEERRYLEDLRNEPEEDQLRCQYVEALEKLWKAEAVEKARKSAKSSKSALPIPIPTQVRDKGKRVVQPTDRLIDEATDLYTERCNYYEAQLGIDRWQSPDDPNYKKARQYYDNRQYQRALDKLEYLVVQRLMELHKCHIRGTNYKLRTHIAKHLQARSATIRKALTSYNLYAGRLKLPKLDFKQIVKHSFLGEFDLLRIGRQDIRSKPWSTPYNRLLRDKHFKVLRSREEIPRLNVEIERVRDRMEQERREYTSAVKALQLTNPSLSSELHNEAAEMVRVQTQNLYWLDKCMTLAGYTGKIYPRVRVTLRPIATSYTAEDPIPTAEEAPEPSPDEALADEDGPDDPEVDEDVDAIVGLLSNMARLG